MKQTLFILIVFFGNTLWAAGGVSGGGGKGLVCRDQSKKIISVELLDLWEARILYKRSIANPNLPIEQMINNGIQNLKTSLYSLRTREGKTGYESTANALKRYAELFLKGDPNLIELRDVALTLTDDSYEAIKPKQPGCEIEQIVTYFDYYPSDRIYLDAEIYNAMDKVNKAGLILHEALYKVLREESYEANSRRTRRAVGIAMSGQKIPAIRDYVNSRPHLKCELNYYSKNPTLFYLVEHSNTNGLAAIAFVPETINGVYVLDQRPNGGITSYNGIDFHSLDDLFNTNVKFSASEINPSEIDYDITWDITSVFNGADLWVYILDFSIPNGSKFGSEPDKYVSAICVKIK